MCGIFGIISRDTIEPSWVETLGLINRARGNLAFGGLVWSPESARVFRFSEPFDFSKIDLTETKVFLGHIRAPTGKQSNDIRVVHPFETAALFLAHNGLLLNHTDFSNWQIQPNLAVDSQVIIGGIQHYLDRQATLVSAIRQTISQLQGQQGCWLWSKAQPALHLWRVMSSIYYSYQPGQFIFSSVKCDLADQLLPEGAIYRVDPEASRFSEVGQFEFYNPYKFMRS